MDQEVVIVAAVRTPIGSLNGSLKMLRAHELGAVAIKAVINKCSILPSDISDVIIGQVLSSGQGQNPARQAAILAGIPFEVPACTVNMVCGSGLRLAKMFKNTNNVRVQMTRSVLLACQSIKCGDSTLIVCGGQESMSNAPHALHVRPGVKFGNLNMIDTMVCDGLTCAIYQYHMGITAENVAKKWNISRETQDKFSVLSQKKAENAQKSGLFLKEIVPVKVTDKKSVVEISEDEFPRHGTTLEKLGKLNLAFAESGLGTVTAGNASGLNDGAAMLILCSLTEARRRHLTPLAKIVSYAQVGIDPSIMGMAPVPAVQKALQIANWTTDDVDLFELNEAFAAQSIAVLQELNIHWDCVNINGGAIALGHPIGASGARILVTLIHALNNFKKNKGVAALCIGGGMGIAICIETIFN